jgi:hypothetical protein
VKTDGDAMSAEMPTPWKDITTGDWTRDDKTVGIRIGASSDYQKWLDGYDVAGAFLATSATFASDPVEKILNADKKIFSKDCTYDSRNDYDASGYAGKFDIYKDCGGTKNSFVELVVKPADESLLVFMQLVAVGDRDFNAADHMIETLKVNGPLP